MTSITYQQSVCQAYMYLARSSGKGYTQISQKKLLDILAKYYGVSMCRRNLNYILRRLEDRGMIRRIPRKKRGPDGKIIFHTTIVVVCAAMYRAFEKLARFFKKIKWVVHMPQAVEQRQRTLDLYYRMFGSRLKNNGPPV